MIEYVTVTEVERNAFTVEVKVGGQWFYYDGPRKFAFFTRSEADKLAGRVQEANEINPHMWSPSSYGAEERELNSYRDMEDEYFSRYN